MPRAPEIDIHPITIQLAEALTLAETGKRWTVNATDDRPWIQALISPEGHEIRVERAKQVGKISIHVAFKELYDFLPRDHPSYQRTLNPQRPIGDLAREVRRLLDSARPAIAKARAQKTAADDYEARREQLAAQLARLAGYERATHEPLLIYVGRYDHPSGRGRAKIDGPDTVHLDIRVPPRVAEQIITLMTAS